MESKTVEPLDSQQLLEPKHPYKYVEIIVCLLATMVMPVYLYGFRVLFLLFAGLATALAAEYLCVRFSGRKRIEKKDYSYIVTALIVVLLMPATVSPWFVVISVAIALVVAKHPFGGTGKNIFNPAAVGVAFSAICWPEELMRYPIPFTTQGVVDSALIQYGVSPASSLRVGGTPKIDYFDVLLGKFSGPLGTTCMIVLGCCLLFLLLRRVASPQIVFSAFGVVFLTSILFPRVVTGEWSSLIFEFCSGAFVFGVIFMANDPATMPDTKGGRVFYGVLIGLLVFFLRRYGQMELEFVFVILLANVFASSCDKYAAYLADRFRALTKVNLLGKLGANRSAGKKRSSHGKAGVKHGRA